LLDHHRFDRMVADLSRQGRVRTELIEPLFAQFVGTYRNSARRFVAEDDHVVVQCRGQVMTCSGERTTTAIAISYGCKAARCEN
jgi:hypothetical protein